MTCGTGTAVDIKPHYHAEHDWMWLSCFIHHVVQTICIPNTRRMSSVLCFVWSCSALFTHFIIMQTIFTAKWQQLTGIVKWTVSLQIRAPCNCGTLSCSTRFGPLSSLCCQLLTPLLWGPETLTNSKTSWLVGVYKTHLSTHGEVEKWCHLFVWSCNRKHHRQENCFEKFSATFGALKLLKY